MWDEEERFGNGVAKVFTWALVILGAILAAVSLATGITAFFLAFLSFLVILGAIILVWALVMGGLLVLVVGFMALWDGIARRAKFGPWRHGG
jgi:hypothetical protein